MASNTKEPVLVVLQLSGGNDGLNTVIPYSNPLYYDNRPYVRIPEDQVLDAQSLPKVKMPIGGNYAGLPDWKPKTARLKGYPH